MRKSFWMIPVGLLFTALSSPTARADTIVTSNSIVTGIDGITIAGTIYNVTFGTAMDMTFSGSPANASIAASDIVTDLNALAPSLLVGSSSGTPVVVEFGVDGGADTFAGTCCFDFPQGLIWVFDSPIPTLDVVKDVGDGSGLWAEFTPVATPEPGSATLALPGLGLLGLLVVIRKRFALRYSQAT